MKDVVAIRHVAFEDLGTWAAVLMEAGFSLTYLDAGVDCLDLASDADLVVILGGPIGAYQEREYPFLLDEFRLVEARIRRRLPLIGICLGSQIIARVLGSKVYPNGQKEIGWSPLTLTFDNGPMQDFDGSLTSMFHWHGDTFDLPEGATLLASTKVCKHQIYSFGEETFAFQCHPEVEGRNLERWWIGHAGELDSLGLSPSALREESARLCPVLKAQSQRFLRHWLERFSAETQQSTQGEPALSQR